MLSCRRCRYIGRNGTMNQEWTKQIGLFGMFQPTKWIVFCVYIVRTTFFEYILLLNNPPRLIPPLRTKKYCTNYYIFSGVFGWWNLMKCLSPNALISLILPHYELFIEFESHGDNTLKMGKSNSSEKKKMKRPMFCPSLSRKSEGRKNLTSLPWSESIASWATLISGKCARQVRSRKHL